MKYILTHDTNRTNKTFKNEEKLRDFLEKNKWSYNFIDCLLSQNHSMGWELEIIPSNNRDAFNLIWKKVYNEFYDSNYDCSLSYFVKNDYRFLAVNSWLDSGDSKFNFPVRIPKYKLKEELRHFYDCVDYFQCSHCNHVGFYDYDDEINYKNVCLACDKKDLIPSNRNIVKLKKLLQNIAS